VLLLFGCYYEYFYQQSAAQLTGLKEVAAIAIYSIEPDIL